MVVDQQDFAYVKDHISPSNLRRHRERSWNRSHSTFDELRNRRTAPRYFDSSCPSIAIECYKNVGDTRLASSCSLARDRIHRSVPASLMRFSQRVVQLGGPNDTDNLALRESYRIQPMINPDKNREMDLNAPCLHGRWTSDWSAPGHIAHMKKLRARVENYARQRNSDFEGFELNRVHGLQRDKMGEQGIVQRIEDASKNIPVPTVHRDGIFMADSRMRFHHGLNRPPVHPQTGHDVMRMAREGLQANARAYAQGRSVVGP